MKGSLIIVAFFVAGVILARWGVLPQELLQQDFSMYVLYGLMFLVGISIGSDRKAWAALKGQQLRIVLVPDRKSTRLNSSHPNPSRMPSSA